MFCVGDLHFCIVNIDITNIHHGIIQGAPQKKEKEKGTAYFPQYVGAITGISV